MSTIIHIFNEQIEILENVQKRGDTNSTNLAIASYLVSIWRKKQKLPKITILSKILNISLSSISKFIKKYKMESYQVLRYIFKCNNNQDPNLSVDIEKNLRNTVRKILEAKRVLLLGTGNSGLLAKAFYARLILNNIYAIFLEGKPDQIKMIKQMTNKDLIICISFSMNHKWSSDLFQMNKNSIFFTSKNITAGSNQIVLNSQNPNKLKSDTADSLEINFVYEKIDKIINFIDKQVKK